jgi:excisionase family DNA binding protein
VPKPPPTRGLTVRDAARLLRVSADKIRLWIKMGELSAINTAGPRSPRPRYVVLPSALEQFAERRSPATPAKSSQRKKRITQVDYFPGL